LKTVTKTVEIEVAQRQLRELLCLAAAGHEVIISEGKLRVARLVPVGRQSKTRTPGLNRGQAWIAPDFDAPLPDEFWLGSE